LYDFANSAYTTTTLAVFLPVLFASEIVPEGGVRVFGWTLDGESTFTYLVGVTAVIAFFFSPMLGAVGDFSASKLRFLKIFGLVGAAASTLFALAGPGDVWFTAALFIVVESCWAFSNVFYDSFLPHLTSPETIDRVSSKGFAFGYLGGGSQYLLSLLLVSFSPESFQATAVRIAIVAAGVWWFAFALLSFRRLREPSAGHELPAEYRTTWAPLAYLKLGFARTLATTRRLRHFPQLLLFLLAFLLYNDGVQTVVAVASVFAIETLGLEVSQVLIAFLAVQIVGLAGALGFGWLATRIGTKRAILGALVLWTGSSAWGYLLPEGRFLPFLALACTIGVILGGTQALSRSLFGSMIPEEASAEFYGFYSVFAKFSAIWGTFLFARVNQVTGSSRRAVLSLVVLFALGFVTLAMVNVDRARLAKSQWRFEGAEVEAT